jgi:PAS domain S-box-containing protein
MNKIKKESVTASKKGTNSELTETNKENSRDKIETGQSLFKTEEYFKALIENSLDVKAIISPDGKIEYVSPSIERVLGYTPEDLIGEHTSKFIHPADQMEIKNVFANIVKIPGFTTSVEFRFRHKKGRWCIIESLIKNLLNNNVVSGIIVSSRDITSKKDAENSIKSLLNISEKLNSTLDVDIIMDILITEAINLIGAEGGCTGLKTTEGLMCKKYFDKNIAVNYEFCWPPGLGIPGWLIQNKMPYITNDASKDTVILKDIIKKFNINSVACIPIFDMKNDVIGFLEVKNKLNHSEFTEGDKEKLVSLAQIASITIQNALAYQKIQMAEFQLKISREQLRRLSAHLQSAREEERTRIAREIHDELGQSLTGLKMDISWLSKKMQNLGIDNPQLQEKAAGMSALVDSTIKTVRKISSELRPGVLDYLGLPAAIEWQSQDFQNRTGILCNIISLPKDLQLDQNKSTAIFRIFQETLTNVARHAQASAIDIELLRENDKLILEIEDNGRGITDGELLNTSSFGILGMRERTLLLGGEFTIRGEINKGTTVLVKIPITESNDGGGLS